jgi:alkylresorcinol/alkylpyrone synthase
LIFVSTTGIATPSLDALLINKMKLNPNVNRTPIWGLGCAGGVSGVAKANTAAKANPDAVVLLVAVELCSLTFIGKDYSKSNFIATSLFSDGAACCLIAGDNVAKRVGGKQQPSIIASQSKLYYDTLDVMGWDVKDDGLKVIFSRDIPTIIKDIIKPDIESFLEKHDLNVNDVRNWIAHPGGAKVIAAYTEALNIDRGCFENTIDVLRRYGNMSSVTVLYVLKEFFDKGFENGYGVMMSLGPGFSSELVLLRS